MLFEYSFLSTVVFRIWNKIKQGPINFSWLIFNYDIGVSPCNMLGHLYFFILNL